jgi:hypothetical protein
VLSIWCKIDIDVPVDLDRENTIFAFSAVIGTKDVQDHEGLFPIQIEVIYDSSQQIYFHESCCISESASLDLLYFHSSRSHLSQQKMDNLRAIFKLKYVKYSTVKYFKPTPVFFKSCRFHLENRYEEEAIDLIDGVQLSKRRRDDDDDEEDNDDNLEPQQKRHSSSLGSEGASAS